MSHLLTDIERLVVDWVTMNENALKGWLVNREDALNSWLKSQEETVCGWICEQEHMITKWFRQSTLTSNYNERSLDTGRVKSTSQSPLNTVSSTEAFTYPGNRSFYGDQVAEVSDRAQYNNQVCLSRWLAASEDCRIKWLRQCEAEMTSWLYKCISSADKWQKQGETAMTQWFAGRFGTDPKVGSGGLQNPNDMLREDWLNNMNISMTRWLRKCKEILNRWIKDVDDHMSDWTYHAHYSMTQWATTEAALMQCKCESCQHFVTSCLVNSEQIRLNWTKDCEAASKKWCKDSIESIHRLFVHMDNKRAEFVKLAIYSVDKIPLERRKLSHAKQWLLQSMYGTSQFIGRQEQNLLIWMTAHKDILSRWMNDSLLTVDQWMLNDKLSVENSNHKPKDNKTIPLQRTHSEKLRQQDENTKGLASTDNLGDNIRELEMVKSQGGTPNARGGDSSSKSQVSQPWTVSDGYFTNSNPQHISQRSSHAELITGMPTTTGNEFHPVNTHPGRYTKLDDRQINQKIRYVSAGDKDRNVSFSPKTLERFDQFVESPTEKTMAREYDTQGDELQQQLFLDLNTRDPSRLTSAGEGSPDGQQDTRVLYNSLPRQNVQVVRASQIQYVKPSADHPLLVRQRKTPLEPYHTNGSFTIASPPLSPYIYNPDQNLPQNRTTHRPVHAHGDYSSHAVAAPRATQITGAVMSTQPDPRVVLPTETARKMKKMVCFSPDLTEYRELGSFRSQSTRGVERFGGKTFGTPV